MQRKDLDDFVKRGQATRTPEQEQRYAELKGRRGKEMQLWHTWNEGGRQPSDLAPLLKSIDPLVRSETKKRLTGLGGSIPSSALHNELRNAAARAVQTYDPTRGSQLTSHITTNFQRITDFVAANRNERYMPREDVEHYQSFSNVKHELEEELGREPTHAELLQRLPDWSAKKVKKMQHGFGAEVYTDMGTEFESQDQKLRPRDAIQLVRHRLKPVEQQFAEMHYPEEGHSPHVKQIAKTLGVTPAKVYRIKSRVEELIAPILKGE